MKAAEQRATLAAIGNDLDVVGSAVEEGLADHLRRHPADDVLDLLIRRRVRLHVQGVVPVERHHRLDALRRPVERCILGRPTVGVRPAPPHPAQRDLHR